MTQQLSDRSSMISRTRRIAHLDHGVAPRAECMLCYATWVASRRSPTRPARIADPVRRPVAV
jgi:hypothetical protein